MIFFLLEERVWIWHGTVHEKRKWFRTHKSSFYSSNEPWLWFLFCFRHNSLSFGAQFSFSINGGARTSMNFVRTETFKSWASLGSEKRWRTMADCENRSGHHRASSEGKLSLFIDQLRWTWLVLHLYFISTESLPWDVSFEAGWFFPPPIRFFGELPWAQVAET